jgi:hypothetical protein
VNHKLAQVLKEYLPARCLLANEPSTLSHSGGARRGDLSITDPSSNYRCVLDLVITDPTARYNIAEHSYDTRYAATARAEREKISKYLDTEWYRQGIFKPIAISATGMMGEMAVAAFKALKIQYELPDSFLSNISRNIGIICSKYWAKINIQGRIIMRGWSVYNASTNVDVMDVG